MILSAFSWLLTYGAVFKADVFLFDSVGVSALSLTSFFVVHSQYIISINALVLIVICPNLIQNKRMPISGSLLARIVFALLLAISWWGGLPALAEVKEAVLTEKTPNSQMNLLKWKSDDLDIETGQVDGKSVDFAILRGEFSKPKWHLIWKTDKVELSEEGDFEIKVPLPLGHTKIPVQIIAIGPLGEVENSEYFISVVREEISEADKARRISLSSEIGISSISYKEAGVPDFSEIALTLKAGVSRRIFLPCLEAGMSTFFTAFPLSKSIATTSARFLGVNLRLGYVLFENNLWKIALHGGFYYTTMFVTENQFGFENMGGVQLFPSIQRMRNNGDVIRSYLKFSPVSSNDSALSFSNRELALGAAYAKKLQNGHLISFSGDLAVFSLNIQTIAISSTSVTLGVGYGL